MDDTNCGQNCAFVKSGFCKNDCECPFFVETWWELEGNPHPKKVKDCFPKKLTMEQNNLLHRHLCLQSVVEDVRNRMDRIEGMLLRLVSSSNELIAEINQDRIELNRCDNKKLELDLNQE